ncbi:hypothetical protein CWI37_2234p0010 [Hamiltosporidium tvaerminnensis]|uniref:Uncharacterized protein n=2 Tax=Hamiltosporidium TaxID=1176354 RepID=A0A4V6MV92_9MICR|nr:hypothetical protein LUQ84_001398 [Hamiltosporidium tvaerminnensis]TBT97489.1 hypothetical protein CWI37_2234p0010 [Hamiltosporidium tvaerminnensis]TBT99281.1 hypothetical protein CWI39_2077p0010 [Hamiltosporidium magnivora]
MEKQEEENSRNKKNKNKKVTFLEENLEANEKYFNECSFKEIEEPKTPYNRKEETDVEFLNNVEFDSFSTTESTDEDSG